MQVTGEKLIHSYDTERRRVLCGVPEQTSSTKHAAGVTCSACRALLRGDAPGAAAPDEADEKRG